MNRRRILVGQVVCVAGMLLLLAYVPFAPRTLGAPRHRILEMGLFWLTQALVLFGSGQSLAAVLGHPVRGQPVRAKAMAILASLGMLILAGTCLVALTNLLCTTVQGVGFRVSGTHSGLLYPRELGYALALPLLLAVALQVPLASLPQPSSVLPVLPRPARIVRLLSLILLAVMLFAFAATCFFFLIDRRFVAAAVGMTWIAGCIFVVLAFEQLVWTLVRAQAGSP